MSVLRPSALSFEKIEQGNQRLPKLSAVDHKCGHCLNLLKQPIKVYLITFLVFFFTKSDNQQDACE